MLDPAKLASWAARLHFWCAQAIILLPAVHAACLDADVPEAEQLQGPGERLPLPQAIHCGIAQRARLGWQPIYAMVIVYLRARQHLGFLILRVSPQHPHP